MMQLYWTTTPLSIILIIINIIFQNMYQYDDLDDESEDDSNSGRKKKTLTISINPEDKSQMAMFFIGVLLVLFVPIINILIALIISVGTIISYVKQRKK